MIHITNIKPTSLKQLNSSRKDLQPIQHKPFSIFIIPNLPHNNLPHSTKIIPKPLTQNIIIHKITTPIHNNTPLINLHTLQMMRRMTMNYINTTLINKKMSQSPYFLRRKPGIIGSPMHGNNLQRRTHLSSSSISSSRPCSIVFPQGTPSRT